MKKNINIFKKIPKVFYTIASLVATAAINYTIVHNGFILIVTLVLLAHELGHYFAAKIHGAKVSLPFFIPFPFLIIAITRITGLDAKGIKDTAFYGPFTGLVTTLIILALNSILNIFSPIPLMILAASEVVLNYFGSDGKKYRKAKRSLLCS